MERERNTLHKQFTYWLKEEGYKTDDLTHVFSYSTITHTRKIRYFSKHGQPHQICINVYSMDNLNEFHCCDSLEKAQSIVKHIQ